MTKKRRMPVNILEGRPEREADETFIEGIVRGPAAAEAGASPSASRAEPAAGSETGEGGPVRSDRLVDASGAPPRPAASEQTREWLEARRLRRAESVLRSRSLLSAVVGLVPLSLVALAVLAGIQAEMSRALAREYDFRYRGVLVRSLIASAFVGAWATWVAAGAAVVLSVLPVPRPVIEILCLGLSAAASSYVVGKVFIKHFEAGGTLLDLNPTATRDYFRQKHGQGSNSDRPVV